MQSRIILMVLGLPLMAQNAQWTSWSPRAEIAPRTYLDELHSKTGSPALALSGQGNPAVFGGWERNIAGIHGGSWYRFRALYRAEGVDYPARQVVARLDWTTNGARTGQPDYPWTSSPVGEWTALTLDSQAPASASGVRLQLLLVNAPRATVWWDDVSLEPVDPPAARNVSIASINLRPRDSADPVAEFLAAMQRGVPAKTDVVVLPEGITVVGTSKKYTDVAESVPGPTTTRLGEFARVHKTWIVAGIYEREGTAIYNTAVLIDRNGHVAGRYRKVYLPREEFEGGLTPGSDYPVFRTDFGTVGLMICWDLQYPDPARALTLRGAEMILMPIWGGSEALAKARAIENQVFLVASGYDHPTYIMDPAGELLSRAPSAGVAVATIDLNRRYLDPWLGDMRARMRKELRGDVTVDPTGRR